MADYKELLRRAISALPENNGAARRAVYEKARSALVGQLRAITPPLPARDITQHRLQLEDCIRQVEQEASEAVISLGRDSALAMRTPPVDTAAAAPKPIAPQNPVSEAPKPDLVVAKATEAPADVMSIEDIISQAAAAGSTTVIVEPEKPMETVPLVKTDLRSVPPITARAEASKSGPSSPIPQSYNVRPLETPLKPASFEPRREPIPFAANSTVEPLRTAGRVEPLMGNQAVARQQAVEPQVVVEPVAVEPALSNIREVEVEASQPDTSEAEGAIERAIETLDREARGEATPALPARPSVADDMAAFAMPPSDKTQAADDDSGFAPPPAPQRSGAGLTIFLVVFAVLLAGAGGAGFWAWREGYVDLDQMFGQAQATTTTQPAEPALETVVPTADAGDTDAATGPGNTATATPSEPTSALEGLEIEDRLEPTPEAVVPNGTENALPGLATELPKGEERLTGETAPSSATSELSASVDPAILAGSQSLPLEASADGQTGAVPFSGTVEWSEGVDDIGLPTLIGTANIPARNLGVRLTIRKNSDPSLPASHLMEVDFQVSDTFMGGTIANLPGVLLKDEELVPGTPLVGASARVVGNSFLFALSASPADATTNTGLLESRKWMDLAVVYGTGRNAIITLEKDADAQALFDKVFAAWK